ANTTATGVVVDMGTTTIPAGAKVKGVRLSIRAKDDMTTAPLGCVLAAKPYLGTSVGNGVQSTAGQTAITAYDGAYETAKPGGGPWLRSEERRVGKECRSRGWAYQ